MTRRCESEATLTAFADDALPGAARDRVAAHLAECPRCCAEVAEVRRVQHLLGSTRSARDTPPNADRLVSIAGPRAHQPLWTQPFDRPDTEWQPLPSRRSERRRTMGGAAALLVGVMMGLVVAGWAAAPPPDAPIVNPVSKARAEFSHVAAQLPFVMDGTVAAWAMPDREQQTFTRGGAITPLPVVAGPALSAEEARTVLVAGEQALRVVDHRSTERVLIATGDDHLTVGVKVRHHSVQGTEIDVLAGDRSAYRSAFLPAREAEALPLPTELSGRRDQRIGDRAAVLIEARRDGKLVARWWFDQKTALQLGQESYAPDGSVLVQVLVTDLTVDRQEFQPHTPPQLVRPSSAAYLSLSEAGDFRERGWSCHQALAGLPLTRLGSDEGTAVQSTYSDGASAITVRQERGTILAAPEGFTWDDTLGVYRREGAPTMMIWQSKDSVFTVVTDGSAELAAAAVGELPHEAPVLRTRFGRIQAGWQHIVETVAGR